jgi:hypothetical protein
MPTVLASIRQGSVQHEEQDDCHTALAVFAGLYAREV